MTNMVADVLEKQGRPTVRVTQCYEDKDNIIKYKIEEKGEMVPTEDPRRGFALDFYEYNLFFVFKKKKFMNKFKTFEQKYKIIKHFLESI